MIKNLQTPEEKIASSFCVLLASLCLACALLATPTLIHLDGSEKISQQATGLLQAPSSHEEFSDSTRDAHIALIRNVRIPDFLV